MPEIEPKKYVFISHASADRESAEMIADYLQAAGISCWIASRDVLAGRLDYTVQLHSAIERASAFIVCLSSAANESIFVRAETEMAFTRCPIFPVRLEQVMPQGGLALFLRISQWTDLFGRGRKANLARLADAVGGVLEQEVTPPPPEVAEEKPLPPPSAPVPPAMAQPQGYPLSDDDAVRQFIGPNAPRMLEKWRSLDRRNSQVGWSFPAFFFGGFWLLYRKMWSLALALLTATTLLAIFSMQAEVSHAPALQILCGLVSIGIGVFLALRSDSLYREHVRTRVARINVAGTDVQLIRDRLTIAGGTSLPAALGAAVTFLFAIIIAASLITYPGQVTVPVPEPDNSTTNVEEANETVVDTNETMTAMSNSTSTCRPQYVSVRNETGEKIYQLTARAEGATDYSNDLLGRETIAPGDTKTVDVGPTTCACSVEFHAVFLTGTPLNYSAFNVCESPGGITLGPPENTTTTTNTTE